MIVRDLEFAYKNHKIFENVNFNVKDGEILMVLGVNGVGKSTLMKCLANILHFKGEIDLENIKRTQVGYMNQNIISSDCLSVYEFILLGRIGDLKFKVKDEDLERVDHVIKHVKIEHLAQKNFSELSGGQQRLVIIAQMLAKKPKLMLLDEPTANLDIVREREIMNLIRDYSSIQNVPVVINMHNLNHAFEYADKILLLSGGGVKYFGEKDGLSLDLLGECFSVRFDTFYNSNNEKVIAETNVR